VVAATTSAISFASAAADGAAAYVQQKDMATGHTLSAVLGERYETIVTELYRATDTLQSHNRIVVATLDGAIVGHISCIPTHEFAARARASARILARSSPRVRWRLAVTALRRRLSGNQLGPWAPGQHYIQSLAVAASARRQGIAAQLIDQAIHRARRDDASALVLNTRADNTAAMELYAKHGFVIARRRGANLRLKRPLRNDA